MLMLLTTAREGRLSANQRGCPSSRSSQTRSRSPTSRAAVFVCLALSPSGYPNDKIGNPAGVLYRH